MTTTDRALLLVTRPTPAGVDTRSLAALVRAVAERVDGPAPEVRIAAGLTEVVTDAVVALAGTDGEPVTVSAGGFASPAFSELDVPARHLFVCRGPRCLVYGAGETHLALAAAARGTTTKVTPCGCLGPCNLGPLVVDGATWHRSVGADDAAALVALTPGS